MEHGDQTIAVSNPHILGAVYFALLAIIATIIVDKLLYVFGAEEILPISEAIALAVVVASIFGALFAKPIICSKAPYKLHVFFWAVLMIVLALPVYDLGLFFLLHQHHIASFMQASWMQLVYLYLFILAYSFILGGIGLAIVAGFAAIYLRAHLVGYITDSLNAVCRKPHHHK